MPSVVIFSPKSAGRTRKPLLPTSTKSSEWIKWTWRRLGLVGSTTTRERCFTVFPKWASPSTPNPSIVRISETNFFENLWEASLATATTLAFDIASPIVFQYTWTHIRCAIKKCQIGLVAAAEASADFRASSSPIQECGAFADQSRSREARASVRRQV